MSMRTLHLVLPILLLSACAGVKRCAYEGVGRDAWQLPERVIETLALKPGDLVVDLGAGSGYFTFRLAAAVGEEGRVYAVDIDPDMIAYLEEQIADHGYDNVETVLASPDDPGLPEDDIDLVFASNTYHHLSNRSAYFRRLASALAPDGRIAVVEFDEPEGFFHRTFLASHATDPEVIEAELVAAGYRLIARHPFLPRQSFQVFSRSPAAADFLRP